MKRSILLTTIAGAAFILLGLVFLGASLNDPELKDARMGGLLMMAFGAMVIAVPMYIDARRMLSGQKESKQTAIRKGASRCIVCGDEIAILWCTSHSVGVCLDCISQHHDGTRCLYRPILQQLPGAKEMATPTRSRGQ